MGIDTTYSPKKNYTIVETRVVTLFHFCNRLTEELSGVLNLMYRSCWRHCFAISHVVMELNTASVNNADMLNSRAIQVSNIYLGNHNQQQLTEQQIAVCR